MGPDAVLKLTNEPNKLQRYITLPGTNTIAYSAHLEVRRKIKCCEYGPSLPYLVISKRCKNPYKIGRMRSMVDLPRWVPPV